MVATSEKSKAHDSATVQVADAAHEAVDRIAEAAARAEDKIRRSVEQAEQDVRRGGQEARVRADELTNSVTTMVKEHPLASLGVAFFAGVVISSLMRR